MTDEEKAEEWCKNNCGVWVKDCNFACNGKQGVLYGLAEGRKEKCLEQNNDGTIRPCEVMKENEKLKEELKRFSNVDEINNLQTVIQNKDRKRIHKLEKENNNLKKEIEKLKNEKLNLKTKYDEVKFFNEIFEGGIYGASQILQENEQLRLQKEQLEKTVKDKDEVIHQMKNVYNCKYGIAELHTFGCTKSSHFCCPYCDDFILREKE